MFNANPKWIESIFQAVAAGDRPDWAVFDWYAQDRYGWIGALESVGHPIPRAVFHDQAEYIAIAELLDQRPRSTTAEVIINGNQRQNACVLDIAERGIYVFAWDDNAGGYALLARPMEPLHVDQLPDWAQRWFGEVRLQRAVFNEGSRKILDLSAKGLDFVK